MPSIVLILRRLFYLFIILNIYFRSFSCLTLYSRAMFRPAILYSWFNLFEILPETESEEDSLSI
jgi:hypothetical protein